MTKQQRAKVRKILANDCQLSGTYYDRGKTCAIGALALAAGVKPRKFKEYNTEGIDVEELTPVAEAITSRFGLSLNQMMEIQEANDMILHDAEERRRNVLDALDSF